MKERGRDRERIERGGGRERGIEMERIERGGERGETRHR